MHHHTSSLVDISLYTGTTQAPSTQYINIHSIDRASTPSTLTAHHHFQRRSRRRAACLSVYLPCDCSTARYHCLRIFDRQIKASDTNFSFISCATPKPINQSSIARRTKSSQPSDCFSGQGIRVPSFLRHGLIWAWSGFGGNGWLCARWLAGLLAFALLCLLTRRLARRLLAAEGPDSDFPCMSLGPLYARDMQDCGACGSDLCLFCSMGRGLRTGWDESTLWMWVLRCGSAVSVC